MLLLTGGKVLHKGSFQRLDILVGGAVILGVYQPLGAEFKEVLATQFSNLQPIDMTDKLLVPGFIDGHVHICGGGGEGSFKTRTRELEVLDMVRAGITTVVGCLGTDGVSRSMEGLVAKMYSLREEGVSAYCYTGSYRLPLKTVTGDIMKDLMMIEGIIGIGEVAVSDHRSAHASTQALAQAVSDSRVAGKLSGKCGICNLHLGDGKEGLKPLMDVLEITEIPITQFLPTHINRNPHLFQEGIEFAKAGGYVDFTTSTTPQFIEEGELPAAQAVMRMLEAGEPMSQMTLTSDGQGSLPAFDGGGNLVGLTVGRMSTLWETAKSLHLDYNLPLEEALKPITENPAKILKLQGKGYLEEGCDADIVALDAAMTIEAVICKGFPAVLDKQLVWKPTFTE